MRKSQNPRRKHATTLQEIDEKIEAKHRKLASLFAPKQAACDPPAKFKLTRITTGQFSQDEEVIWGRYFSLKSREHLEDVTSEIRQARSDIICYYLSQAGNFANLFDRYQMPHYSLTEPADLEQAAYKGLIDAVDAYDPYRGVSFMSFARLRIKGAMLDLLREMQEYPRSISENRRTLKKLIEPLKQKLARNPNVEDVIAEYGEQYRQMLEDRLMFSGVFNQVKQKQVNGTPVNGFDSDYHDADYVIDATQTRQESNNAMNMGRIEKEEEILAHIKDQELRLIVRFYYFHGMTNKKVSGIIGKSLSTTVNRHKMALEFLKSKFTLEEFKELIK
jgi:RNA polymerase sigma factor for flagellar operon FliA